VTTLRRELQRVCRIHGLDPYRTMTVNDLRAQLKGLPDDTMVLIDIDFERITQRAYTPAHDTHYIRPDPEGRYGPPDPAGAFLIHTTWGLHQPHSVKDAAIQGTARIRGMLD